MKSKRTVFISLLVTGILVGTGVSLFAKGRSPVRSLKLLGLDRRRESIRYAVQFKGLESEPDHYQEYQAQVGQPRQFLDFENHSIMTYNDTNTSMISVDLFDNESPTPVQRLLVNFVRGEQKIINPATDLASFA